MQASIPNQEEFESKKDRRTNLREEQRKKKKKKKKTSRSTKNERRRSIERGDSKDWFEENRHVEEKHSKSIIR